MKGCPTKITQRDEFLSFLRRYGAWGYVDDRPGRNRRVVLSYRKEHATCTLDFLAEMCNEGLVHSFPGTCHFSLTSHGRKR